MRVGRGEEEEKDVREERRERGEKDALRKRDRRGRRGDEDDEEDAGFASSGPRSRESKGPRPSKRGYSDDEEEEDEYPASGKKRSKVASSDVKGDRGSGRKGREASPVARSERGEIGGKAVKRPKEESGSRVEREKDRRGEQEDDERGRGGKAREDTREVKERKEVKRHRDDYEEAERPKAVRDRKEERRDREGEKDRDRKRRVSSDDESDDGDARDRGARGRKRDVGRDEREERKSSKSRERERERESSKPRERGREREKGRERERSLSESEDDEREHRVRSIKGSAEKREGDKDRRREKEKDEEKEKEKVVDEVERRRKRMLEWKLKQQKLKEEQERQAAAAAAKQQTGGAEKASEASDAASASVKGSDNKGGGGAEAAGAGGEVKGAGKVETDKKGKGIDKGKGPEKGNGKVWSLEDEEDEEDEEEEGEKGKRGKGSLKKGLPSLEDDDSGFKEREHDGEDEEEKGGEKGGGFLNGLVKGQEGSGPEKEGSVSVNGDVTMKEEEEEEEVDPLDAFMKSLEGATAQADSSQPGGSKDEGGRATAGEGRGEGEGGGGGGGMKEEGGTAEVKVKTEGGEGGEGVGALGKSPFKAPAPKASTQKGMVRKFKGPGTPLFPSIFASNLKIPALKSGAGKPALGVVKSEKGEEGVQGEEEGKEGKEGKGAKVGAGKAGRARKDTKPQIMGFVMGMDSDEEEGEGEGGDEDDEDGEGEQPEKEEDDAAFVKRVASQTKADKLPPVDHSTIDYPPFRKAFYREVKEIERMPNQEVLAFRRENEFRIQGKNVPKPIRTWNQTGVSSKILDQIKKMEFEKPMPIQAQALPVIMSGRDCIGIAKTGSGKTLAFVLPMLRHILDQPPLESGDGPIGLILAPTRELVQQIYNDTRKFAKPLGLHCVPVYGGSGVAQQIGELKRGAEIVVCTPGRMIDVLCTSNGKVTNLRRVTYVVMDEADRMFDMGFEPQISKIIQNIRPDRQTVLFSATFPRSVETLARQVLSQPVTIQVGGRSVVNKDITQIVEIRPDGPQRFLRLLELLGEWGEKGKVLVFVQSQDKCDALFRDLLKSGYPCLSLHGAKDQTDRESTIADFKMGVSNLLIATSVAARGLDVKELELVVNYDAPNHYEDYVHRVGRTGRAGKKGTAVTFLAPDEEQGAPDLVKALELSEQPIPEDLKAMADAFNAKVKAGTVTTRGSGYGGSGFKFNEEEEEAKKERKKAQAKEYGVEEEEEEPEEEEENDGIRRVEAAPAPGSAEGIAAAIAAAAAAASANAAKPGVPLGLAAGVPGAAGLLPGAAAVPAAGVNPIQAAVQMRMQQMGIAPAAGSAAALGAGGIGGVPGGVPGVVAAPGAAAGGPAAGPSAVTQAAAFAAAISLQHTLAKLNPGGAADLAKQQQPKEHYELDFEINDFPQHARWKITHKETLNQINEWTGSDVTIRGVHVPPGKKLDPTLGERKLYLAVSGPTESSVRKAKQEIKRILEEATAASIAHQGHGGGGGGRYSVL